MENKDIEQLLQESADEVQVKDFSERWENIKGRINSAQEVELKETTSETVLATSSSGTVSSNTVIKNWIYSIGAFFLFIAVCLAVVLPITLKQNNTPMYLDLFKLESKLVSEDEFYNKINETDLKLFETEDFEIDNYKLLFTEDNIVVGGSLDVADEDIYATVVFYGTSVKSSFKIGTDYNARTINGFHLEYMTKPDDDGLYSTKAQAVSINICYEFECWSLAENVESFFNKILG